MTATLTGHLLDKHDQDLPNARVVLIPLSGPTSDTVAKKVHAAVVSAASDANGRLVVAGSTDLGIPLIGGEQYHFRAPGAANVLPDLVFTMPLTGTLDLSEIVPEPVDLPATWADTIGAIRDLSDPELRAALLASYAHLNEDGVLVIGAPGSEVPVGGTGGGGSTAQVFTQATPLATWTIPHTLARRPVVAVYVAGSEVIADVDATTTSVTVTHAAPTAGQAVLT